MMQSAPIVFVVDDDVSLCRSLELLIESAGWRSATFTSADEFLSSRRVAAPSCLLLDVSLPDINGLELQKRVAVDRIDMPIIFISGHGDVPMAVQAMKAGAVEFLIKPLRCDALLSAIDRALDRSRATLEHEAAMRELREGHASLSRREREVMELAVAGLLNKQIAAELGISEITVKAHRGKVMRKMSAASFADLVRIAVRLGLAFTPKKQAFALQRCLPRYANGSVGIEAVFDVASGRGSVVRRVGTCSPQHALGVDARHFVDRDAAAGDSPGGCHC